MRVLAAGSLHSVWQPLMAQFPEHVDTQFGPAGLLRERIEAGERCDLFASANLEHPLALQSTTETEISDSISRVEKDVKKNK